MIDLLPLQRRTLSLQDLSNYLNYKKPRLPPILTVSITLSLNFCQLLPISIFLPDLANLLLQNPVIIKKARITFNNLE